MRLIDADELSNVMYHQAFETDTDSQKWDSGCWIRYKMFENAIADAPTVDPVKHGRWIKLPDGKNPSNWFGCYACSVCGSYGQGVQYFKYCNCCGARMDEEADHDDHL